MKVYLIDRDIEILKNDGIVILGDIVLTRGNVDKGMWMEKLLSIMLGNKVAIDTFVNGDIIWAERVSTYLQESGAKSMRD